ncbi:MAG: alpha-ketoacid dehydrogenase subunit beta [Candidatus Humimicrobiaceae bacterium]
MVKKITFRESIRNVLFEEMTNNDDMLLIGENLHYGGSLFSKVINSEFHKHFGDLRVIDSPVSENGIVGAAFGAALAGMTVVAELYSADFLYAVGNEVINDLSKWRYQHRLKFPINLVLRAPMGVHLRGGGGPEHSQCPEGFIHHAPGLTIVIPGTPKDAAGLLRSAIRCGDPVVFLEHRQLYDVVEDVDFSSDFSIPLDESNVVIDGKDITVVAWALMRKRSYEAALNLRKEGIELELIDPRTIKIMDMDKIYKSVEKTKYLLVVEESPLTGSIGSEIIANVAENMKGIKFSRLAMPDIPIPYNVALEAKIVPSVDKIVMKVKEMIH